MRISKPVKDWKQPELFDAPITGMGLVRTVVGDLAQELASEMLGALVHRTDSRADYCPDLSRNTVGSTEYFECKAVGRSRVPFIYGGRLRKDLEFSADHKLVYCVWHHVAKTNESQTIGSLRRLILESMREVYLIPFQHVYKLLSNKDEIILNSSYGRHGRDKLYGSGFRFNLSEVSEFLTQSFPIGITESIRFGWRTS